MKINCLVTLASDKFIFSEYLNDLQLQLNRNLKFRINFYFCKKREKKWKSFWAFSLLFSSQEKCFNFFFNFIKIIWNFIKNTNQESSFPIQWKNQFQNAEVLWNAIWIVFRQNQRLKNTLFEFAKLSAAWWAKQLRENVQLKINRKMVESGDQDELKSKIRSGFFYWKSANFWLFFNFKNEKWRYIFLVTTKHLVRYIFDVVVINSMQIRLARRTLKVFSAAEWSRCSMLWAEKWWILWWTEFSITVLPTTILWKRRFLKLKLTDGKIT